MVLGLLLVGEAQAGGRCCAAASQLGRAPPLILGYARACCNNGRLPAASRLLPLPHLLLADKGIETIHAPRPQQLADHHLRRQEEG